MPFAETDLDKVRASADIVQVIGEKLPLKKAGRHFKTLCPFHTEKTPSFMVNPEKQIFHCFGCGEGGNVFGFVMKYEGVEFPEAVERLADRFAIPLSTRREDPQQIHLRRSEKERFYRINQLAARRFYENLADPERGGRAREYLAVRGIRKEMIREYGLGYAPVEWRDLCTFFREKGVPEDDAEKLGLIRRGEREPFDFFRDRLIFPIISPDGKVLGFSGRALGEGQEPKYLNSPDSLVYAKGESFLGLQLARNFIREKEEVVLVEGNFDQLRLYQEGIRNVVAPLGTAVTGGQIRLLARLTPHFVVLFDGDAAGQRAAARALETFLPLGILPRAVTLPPKEDPDSFVLKSGGEALSRRIEKAPLLLDLKIDQIIDRGGDSAAGRGHAAGEVAELIALLAGPVEKSLYIQRVAQKLGLSEKLMAGQVLKKTKKGSNFSIPVSEEKDRVPAVERTLVEILMAGRLSPREISEIRGTDFTSAPLGEVWEVLREDLQRHGVLSVARVVSTPLPASVAALLTELAVGSAPWQEKEGEAAVECVKRFRIGRCKGILKGISHEIQEAERENDPLKVEALLKRKNELLKEMSILH